jgi:HAD superfamily hydrolase (TIGR01549 family)
VSSTDCAVILDVDGVLLELTAIEEDVFFGAFSPWVAPGNLSRDWNSYRIRNDDDIVDEIIEAHGIPPHEKPGIVNAYHQRLAELLASGRLQSPPVPGAAELLAALSGMRHLGIATANFCEAARLRLQAANLWSPVSALAFGADGGGHKHAILARALATLDVPRHRIVYVGDNVNDVEAGRINGVAFVGFSTSESRLTTLSQAGARHLAHDHQTTLQHIQTLLGA